MVANALFHLRFGAPLVCEVTGHDQEWAKTVRREIDAAGDEPDTGALTGTINVGAQLANCIERDNVFGCANSHNHGSRSELKRDPLKRNVGGAILTATEKSTNVERSCSADETERDGRDSASPRIVYRPAERCGNEQSKHEQEVADVEDSLARARFWRDSRETAYDKRSVEPARAALGAVALEREPAPLIPAVWARQLAMGERGNRRRFVHVGSVSPDAWRTMRLSIPGSASTSQRRLSS